MAPEQMGVARIGHFGFFREQFRDTLWEPYLLPEFTAKPAGSK
jgi:predicted alpha/beta hydrolase